MPSIKSFLAKKPIAIKVAKWINRKMSVDIQWEREKKQVLQKALSLFKENISLDVSKRNGFYIFHNKGNTLVLRNTYEPEVQQALMMLIGLDMLRNKTSVLADIGANIGLHTFYIKSKYPDMLILAFDPSPSSWKYLDLSLRYNKTEGVQVEKIALSNTNGIMDYFNWGEESSADALQNTNRVPGVKPNIFKVPVRKLDDIEGLPMITVYKMDCEGAELSILEGAVNTIIKTQPLILLEFFKTNRLAFGADTAKIFELLHRIDYSIYTIDLKLLDEALFDQLQETPLDNYILLPNTLFSRNAAC